MNITTYELSNQDSIFINNQCKKFKFKHIAKPLLHQAKLDTWTHGLIIHSASRISAEVISKFPNLKFVLTRTAGTDHVDVSACKDAGVEVINLPGQNARAVAEFAIGLMISLSRNIVQFNNSFKLSKTFPKQVHYGMELFGKTLGVIGTGAIGATVIEIAMRGLGMKVLAYDVFPNKALARQLGFKYTSLNNLANSSNIISLHAPFTKETSKMINKSFLSTLKKDSLLINTARGGLVDAKAILQALKTGNLAGYATDVLVSETHFHPSHAIGESKEYNLDLQLLSHPKVLVTPHVAHATKESNNRINEATVAVLKKLLHK